MLKPGLIILMLLAHTVFSYNFFAGWWYAPLGTILILFTGSLIWGRRRFFETGGLYSSERLPVLLLFKILAAAAVSLIVTGLIIGRVAARAGVELEIISFWDYIHDLFYVLNDEIVLGALPLYFLTRPRPLNQSKQPGWLRGRPLLSPAAASLVWAVCLALLHLGVYQVLFSDRALIEPAALLGLVFLGIIRHNLILTCGHIGYAWALHFAGSALLFGTLHLDSASGIRLSEPATFNLYLGSPELLTALGLAALLSLVSNYQNYYNQHPELKTPAG